MSSIESLRILEIGQFPLFKRTLPGQTTLVYTGENLSRVQGLEHVPFGIGLIPRLQRGLSSGRWDVVMCHCPVHPVWDTRHGMLQAIRSLISRLARVRTLGTQFLNRTLPCPLVILDFNDEPCIPRHAFPLLERCALYFKRELPGDAAKAFLNATPAFRNHAMTYSSDFFGRNLRKIKPISAAIPETTVRLASAIDCRKNSDVCFMGSINSTIRRDGLSVLESLRDQGYRIDICRGGVAKEHYLERCAAAWLTWSPEGYGWECLRHYEACVCGSVPVMSYPGVRRHQPLLEGVHGFFYPAEGDGLRRAIVAALTDKQRLEAMASAGKRHVLAHHTHARIVEHILSAVLCDARHA